MATKHRYETTYERTRHDGVIVDSVDVRILFSYSPATPATLTDPATDAEIDILDILEYTGGEPKWDKPQPAVRDWAEAWVIDSEDTLVETAENDLATERDRANDAWFDARKEQRHVRT